METKLVSRLYEIVKGKPDGKMEISFEGNPPVLDAEDVEVNVSDGVTRFLGTSRQCTFSWDELEDCDVEFILEELGETE